MAAFRPWGVLLLWWLFPGSRPVGKRVILEAVLVWHRLNVGFLRSPQELCAGAGQDNKSEEQETISVFFIFLITKLKVYLYFQCYSETPLPYPGCERL